MLDTFTLEGVTYSQQYRKCGKPSCQTCGNGGPGHGPYWYTRDQVTGARAYVGRELPSEMTSARQQCDAQLGAMTRKRHELASQFDALTRLIRNDPLSAGDRQILTALGFGTCLVTRPAGAGTQDTAPALVASTS